jgi:ABC-type antimicrobial peptide transport system permease subunit
MGAGLVAGFGIALWADAAATSLLYGIEPGDPAVIAGIVGVIAGAGLLAAILPARRALRTDPVVALRTE